MKRHYLASALHPFVQAYFSMASLSLTRGTSHDSKQRSDGRYSVLP